MIEECELTVLVRNLVDCARKCECTVSDVHRLGGTMAKRLSKINCHTSCRSGTASAKPTVGPAQLSRPHLHAIRLAIEVL